MMVLFPERFTQMKQSGGYYVTVIEDTRVGRLIGAATLTVEQKFIHNCSLVGPLHVFDEKISNAVIDYHARDYRFTA